ncbi:MAG: RNA polymerase sigma factor [Chloroflexi bacterium]|nr:MAG: RNA polymerase sigma factor [Chloroflexota bacterium]MBL1197087.1 RNA polymerase sigma factor [Chloroflexota bacterium]NOH14382.1 RNA polymerase sigma factor [Chloroflexota bacterium]
MNRVDNQEIVVALQNGSLEALGVLYDRHNKLVYHTALGIVGDPESAADLLQDVFLRLYRFADRVDPTRPIEPWLCRVTANLSYTRVRRRKWLQPIEDATEWLVGERRQMPQHAAEIREETNRVHDAILALPMHQRVVVVLYYLNDFPIQEIAETLEIPVGTVKSRLHFARRDLKKRLDVREDRLPEVHYEFT